MNKVKVSARLVALTQPTVELRVGSAEGIIAYCARVSNPANQDRELGTILDYCIRNRHWSVFEMANAVVEIEAPRDISRQLLRHRSFSFQEFSQRYSDQIEFTERDFRRQDNKNRQNSFDDLDDDLLDEIALNCQKNIQWTNEFYGWMRENNVAKECARVILPEGLTMSRMYVNGTLRSWLHYLDVRDDEGVTQWEHVLVAREVRKVLTPAFPTIFKMMENHE